MTTTTIRPNGLRRSMEEIAERLAVATKGQRDVLLYASDYDTAYPHLQAYNKPTREQWDMVRMVDVKREARSTFIIVLRAALAHRDAAWQIERLREYVWLLGRDDVTAEMDAVEARPTHLPELHAFAMHMGGRFTTAWIEEAGDDRAARMAAGLPCTPGCEQCS